ncbi:hypothetical protein [Micromonospora arborensis]|uniref:hypothetical protein n=1 Tax=Micromonospora arborensis TaxID=2116518 RepID=UPI00370FBBDD
MLTCELWLADDFLLSQGYVITDPGPGQRRVIERDGRRYDVVPACECPDCPSHLHGNYHSRTARSANMDAGQILRRVPDLTPRKLDTWTTSGLLRPTAGSRGTGNRREWPVSELPVIEAMVRLTAIGIPPRLAEQIARSNGQPVEVDGMRLRVDLDAAETSRAA